MALIDKAKADHFDIPDEPGETLQLRQLLRGEKKVAQHPGWSMAPENPPVTLDVLEAQLERDLTRDELLGLYEAEGYDWELLLNAGLVGWSYDVECTPENIARLDDATQRFAVITILGLSRTSRAEGEVGNASSGNGVKANVEPSSLTPSLTSPSADSGDSPPPN